MVNEKHIHVSFDLDDTLYAEVDYTRSALKFISNRIETSFGIQNSFDQICDLQTDGQKNPIQCFWRIHNLPTEELDRNLNAMRRHFPEISLRSGAQEVLENLKARGVSWSILTNGRSNTQMQKIEALGLNNADAIFISEEIGFEKPDKRAYQIIESRFKNTSHFYYIGDNPMKDFIAPNLLGWTTIMLLDDGRNIHPQNVVTCVENSAKFSVARIDEVLCILQ